MDKIWWHEYKSLSLDIRSYWSGLTHFRLNKLNPTPPTPPPRLNIESRMSILGRLCYLEIPKENIVNLFGEGQYNYTLNC